MNPEKSVRVSPTASVMRAVAESSFATAASIPVTDRSARASAAAVCEVLGLIPAEAWVSVSVAASTESIGSTISSTSEQIASLLQFGLALV